MICEMCTFPGKGRTTFNPFPKHKVQNGVKNHQSSPRDKAQKLNCVLQVTEQITCHLPKLVGPVGVKEMTNSTLSLSTKASICLRQRLHVCAGAPFVLLSEFKNILKAKEDSQFLPLIIVFIWLMIQLGGMFSIPSNSCSALA